MRFYQEFVWVFHRRIFHTTRNMADHLLPKIVLVWGFEYLKFTATHPMKGATGNYLLPPISDNRNFTVKKTKI